MSFTIRSWVECESFDGALPCRCVQLWQCRGNDVLLLLDEQLGIVGYRVVLVRWARLRDTSGLGSIDGRMPMLDVGVKC
jgi:hypothetical protein